MLQHSRNVFRNVLSAAVSNSKRNLSSILQQNTNNNEEPIVLTEIRDQVQWITLNRPKQFNALNSAAFDGIMTALESANKNDQVKMVAITGKGKYFSSGNDLKNFPNWMNKFDGDLGKAAKYGCDLAERFVAAFIDFPKPLIGVVNGPAIGVMVTTLALYDYVITADNATFSTPFATLGQSPEGCSTYTFPRIFGPSLASRLLYFSETISAQEAEKYGFVGQVVPAAELNAQINQLLYDDKKGWIPNCYAHSMMNAKSLIRNESAKRVLHQVNKDEYVLMRQVIESGQALEALAKFFEKKSLN